MKIKYTVLALLAACGMNDSAEAQDVNLTNGNIYVKDGEQRSLGSAHIFIDRTGDTRNQNCPTDNFERPWDWGTGILVWRSSFLYVDGDVDITVRPADWPGSKIEQERRGIELNGGGSIDVKGKTTITVDNYIHTDEYPPEGDREDYGLDSQKGFEAMGADSDSYLLGGLDITMLNGNRSIGIYAYDQAKLTVTGGTKIVVKDAAYYTWGISNFYSDQAYSYNYGQEDARLSFDNLDITVQGGNNAIGIILRDYRKNADGEDSITVIGHTKIDASGATEYTDRGQYQVFPERVSNYGIFLFNTAGATFNTAEITTDATQVAGTEAIGTYVFYSNATFQGDVKYVSKAQSKEYEIGALARYGSLLDYQKGMVSEAAVVLNAMSDSTITVNSSEDPNALVQLTGDIVVGKTQAAAVHPVEGSPGVDEWEEGDLNPSGTVTVNLLNAQSSFTGVNELAGEGCRVELNFRDGARWNMTASSPVSNLQVAENAEVNMTYGRDQQTDSGAFVPRTLTADTLSGENGIFRMQADIAADQADQLHVLGEAAGNHQLAVSHTGAEPTRNFMNTYLVRQEQGAATFSLVGTAVDAGVYKYGLQSRTDGAATEWYLVRQNEELTPTAEAVLGISGTISSYAMMTARLSSIRERIGEVRRDPVAAVMAQYGVSGKPAAENEILYNGLWCRTFAGRNELVGMAGGEFEQDFFGTEVGYDRLFAQDASHYVLIGGRLQYSSANQSLCGAQRSAGDVDSYGVAAYASWYDSKGWYTDTVLSCDWSDQSLSTAMSDGTPVTASYDLNTVGISQEVGRMFRLSHQTFLETQGQLAYYRIQGADYVTSNGMVVRQGDMNALLGRVGLVLGKRWDMGRDRFLQPYVKAGVNYEFLGDRKVSVNGRPFRDDVRGLRAYYGVGADWQLNRRVRFYGEFEREEGDYVSTPWSVNVGVRIAF